MHHQERGNQGRTLPLRRSTTICSNDKIHLCCHLLRSFALLFNTSHKHRNCTSHRTQKRETAVVQGQLRRNSRHEAPNLILKKQKVYTEGCSNETRTKKKSMHEYVQEHTTGTHTRRTLAYNTHHVSTARPLRTTHGGKLHHTPRTPFNECFPDSMNTQRATKKRAQHIVRFEP